ncbi:MAG TPA: YciI family protein [Bacteroidota bacterium]|nr:YciI family protein [Bacteroidota bacterium]
MRFMMLMIPEVYQGAKSKELTKDFAPGAEDVEKMTKYNAELAKAGVLISLDGLHPTLSGARVSFATGRPKVTDGPFTESKEVLGGYWMINVKSRAEAVEWATRVPAQSGDIIEVRQVFEMEEFPPDVQKAAESAEVRSQLQKSRK